MSSQLLVFIPNSYSVGKVCQVDYVHLESDLSVYITQNIAKVGFQMNPINLTDFKILLPWYNLEKIHRMTKKDLRSVHILEDKWIFL